MSKLGHFSVHELEKSKFLARIHMEYFHLGIFVMPWVYLIRKYGSRTQAFFFVFHGFFDTVIILTNANIPQGITIRPTSKSATAKETIKKLVEFCKLFSLLTAKMTAQFPIIVTRGRIMVTRLYKRISELSIHVVSFCSISLSEMLKKVEFRSLTG